MPDYATYQVKVTTLTPLHIGSGVTLMHEYDYAIHGGKTWRIDDDGFLEAQQVDDPAFVDRLATTPPAQLLEDDDFQLGSPYFRYTIQGTPRSSAEGAQLQEQLKDAYDRPFLPGSSLKGALRTALGWQLWKDMGLKPELHQLKEQAKWAAQAYERRIFGESPNTDNLRALHVSDSRPLAAERLMVLNARVLGRGGEMASPIELEAIRPETEFDLTIKLDLALFSDWARRQRLNLTGGDGLRALPAIANFRTLLRARSEVAWFAGIANATRLRDFYQQLSKIQPAPNQFVLQLGWGTGWEDKTFGTRLSIDTEFFRQLVAKYRLSRGKGRPGGVFPSSRRVAVSFRKDERGFIVETPAYPLGWVLVTFQETRHAEGGWQSSKVEMPAAPESRLPEQVQRQAIEAPPTQPRTPAVQLAEPARLLVRIFTDRPQVGQRFEGVVLDAGAKQVLLELPGLSADEWMGTGLAPSRRLREGEAVLCEVLAVRPDPENQGGWLVDCRIE